MPYIDNQYGVDSVSQNQPTTSEEAPKAFIDNQSLGTMYQGDSTARFNLKHTELTKGPRWRGWLPPTQMGPTGDSLILD